MAPNPRDDSLTASPTLDHGAGAEERRFSQGQVLANRYEIRHLLGAGGMGEVWLAFDVRLRVEVALKTLLGTPRSWTSACPYQIEFPVSILTSPQSVRG